MPAVKAGDFRRADLDTCTLLPDQQPHKQPRIKAVCMAIIYHKFPTDHRARCTPALGQRGLAKSSSAAVTETDAET